MDKQEIREMAAKKSHNDLIEHGSQVEKFNEFRLDTAQNPVSNSENAALNAMQKIDPFCHLREKTQMKRSSDGWQLVEK